MDNFKDYILLTAKSTHLDGAAQDLSKQVRNHLEMGYEILNNHQITTYTTKGVTIECITNYICSQVMIKK